MVNDDEARISPFGSTVPLSDNNQWATTTTPYLKDSGAERIDDGLNYTVGLTAKGEQYIECQSLKTEMRALYERIDALEQMLSGRDAQAMVEGDA